jgi:hypothetical protein
MELSALKSLSELRCNYNAVKELRNIFQNVEKLPLICLIVGPAGSGKSSIAAILEAEFNMEVLVVTERHTNVETVVTNFANQRTITNMFYPKKKILFFDDSDVLCAIEKNIMAIMQKARSNIPIVCTVSSSEERKVSNIKKISTHTVRLCKMSFKEAYLLLVETLENELEKRPELEDEILKICKEHEGNLNLIVPYVNTLLLTNRTVSKTNELDPMHNVNIYDQTRELLTKTLSPEILWCMTTKDTALISLLVHENLTNFNFHKKKSVELDELLRIYQTFVEYDLYERMIFSKCQWGYSGAETMSYIRFATVNEITPKYKRTSEEIKFTQQFTKLSTQTANKKKFEEVFEGSVKSANICKEMVFAYCTNQHALKSTDKSEADLIRKFSKDFIVCK